MKKILVSVLSLLLLAQAVLAQSTTNLGVTKVQQSQAQKEVTINDAFDLFDFAIAGYRTKSVGSGGTVTLTSADSRYAAYAFTGTLTGNAVVLFPYAQSARTFVVYNNTTGAFTLTVKTTFAGSTGVVVPQGGRMLLYHDGINVYTPSVSGVNSFNGRSGTVVPASSDYSFSQISGSVTDAQVPDTITASNYLPLTGGTLTNTLTVSAAQPRIIFDTTGTTAKGRASGAVANLFTLSQNASFSSPNWNLDDTTIPGWLLKLDPRAGSDVFEVWRFSAGANPRTQAVLFQLTAVGNANLPAGAYQINGTTAIDSSRNGSFVNNTISGYINLTPVAAPSSPASGFNLYVDSADNKLKVKSSGGTVTILANP